jgi:non-ribosomal peptide synthase protein (TIGR01720 family)
VEIRDLFRYRTVRGVAPHIREVNRHAAGAAGRTSASLSAAQARFLAEHLVEPGRFHHSLVLSSDDRIDPQAIAHAFAVLRDHHPSLRLSVSAGRQHVRPAGGPLPGVAVHDLRGNSDAAGEFHALARSAQSAFDLQTDTLWRVAVFRMDAGDRLLIVVHHLCIDGVSWGTLLDDLATAYAQVCAGQPVALPPATDSFLDWSQASADLSSTPQIQSQAAYWRAVEEQIAGVRTPVRDGEAARYRDQVVLASAMSIEHTAALVSEVNRAYNTTAEDVLLAAFARAAWQCFDETRTAVTMEHHGRDGVGDLDLSRTMGWFTSLYPLVLTIDPSHDIGSQIKATKEAIRAVPDRGRGYGLLRYVAAPPVHLTARPAFSFNYLGDVDRRIGSFNLVAEELDGHVNTDAACLAEIELSAMIVARQLRLRIAYNQRRVDASVMEAFLAGWQSAVTDAIEHCRARRHTELTPADLSYSQVTVDELEDMFR